MSEDKVYAVDSTRGASLVNPLNYKGDVLAQVWIDARILATLCRWMDGNGEYARFLSEVVRRPLEAMVGTLVKNEEIEMVDDTVEARTLLERRFGVDLSRGGRGGKNVLHNIVLSERRGELGEELRSREGEGGVPDVERPSRGKKTSKITEEAVKIYKQLVDKEKKERESGGEKIV